MVQGTAVGAEEAIHQLRTSLLPLIDKGYSLGAFPDEHGNLKLTSNDSVLVGAIIYALTMKSAGVMKNSKLKRGDTETALTITSGFTPESIAAFREALAEVGTTMQGYHLTRT